MNKDEIRTFVELGKKIYYENYSLIDPFKFSELMHEKYGKHLAWNDLEIIWYRVKEDISFINLFGFNYDDIISNIEKTKGLKEKLVYLNIRINDAEKVEILMHNVGLEIANIEKQIISKKFDEQDTILEEIFSIVLKGSDKRRIGKIIIVAYNEIKNRGLSLHDAFHLVYSEFDDYYKKLTQLKKCMMSLREESSA